MLQPLLLACIAVVVALVIAFPLGKALKAHPYVFYAAATAIVVVFVLFRQYNLGGVAFRWISPLIQKAYLATALLVIVMFIGVLDEKSALRRRLQPIRGELSVISSILYLAHLATYATAFLPRLGMTIQTQPLMGVAIAVAIPLTCVFAVLSITSLHTVKSHMPAKAWKALQRLSYVMIALVAVHVVFAIGRSALDGSVVAQVSLAVYIVLAVAYAALRIRKAVRDRKSHTVSSQGAA